MAAEADRERLEGEFLDLAARLEGLHHLKAKHVVDPVRLKRWQRQHGEEVAGILASRSVLAKKPAMVSTGDLKRWIKAARKALTAV
ncbi:hypothetical protein [Streptacidiphilus rugosus]|uniref:hypothetical protein n=1 Tax=Streptacidiphilus rugosus TaxID=405783 RepID=UPI00055E5A6F|nr:hypothetical protein [Streptacidiphilus rugosus]